MLWLTLIRHLKSYVLNILWENITIFFLSLSTGPLLLFYLSQCVSKSNKKSVSQTCAVSHSRPAFSLPVSFLQAQAWWQSRARVSQLPREHWSQLMTRTVWFVLPWLLLWAPISRGWGPTYRHNHLDVRDGWGRERRDGGEGGRRGSVGQQLRWAERTWYESSLWCETGVVEATLHSVSYRSQFPFNQPPL